MVEFWCPCVLTAMPGTGSVSGREVELRLCQNQGLIKSKGRLRAMVRWQRDMCRARFGFRVVNKRFPGKFTACAWHAVGLGFESAPPTWLRTPSVET